MIPSQEPWNSRSLDSLSLPLFLSLSDTRHHKISAIAERKRSRQRTTIVQNRLFSRRSTTLFTVCARTISRVATNEYKTCQQPWEVDEERFRASVCAFNRAAWRGRREEEEGRDVTCKIYGFICPVKFEYFWKKIFLNQWYV